jgi:hypothetical protein
MAEHDKLPPLLTEPLTVDRVDNQIVLDGDEHVEVSLTPEAAIETGIRLVNAGIGIDDRDPAATGVQPR